MSVLAVRLPNTSEPSQTVQTSLSGHSTKNHWPNCWHNRNCSPNPLVSLNYLTNSRNIPGALYQFGLLPEDEARQVAEATTARGLRTAIVLAPASSWGDRVAGAFRSAYQAKGGQVINIQQYPDAASNAYMQNVQNALAATQGRASMVFLAASPSQARLMRPLLTAQAPPLPVYATSHVFSGRTDPGKDADLDGILYTEIPWVIEGLQNGSLNNSTFPRMFALGMDAFLIAKNLPSIGRNPNAQVNGKTGNITPGRQPPDPTQTALCHLCQRCAPSSWTVSRKRRTCNAASAPNNWPVNTCRPAVCNCCIKTIA